MKAVAVLVGVVVTEYFPLAVETAAAVLRVWTLVAETLGILGT
jgi:hypothetical protein